MGRRLKPGTFATRERRRKEAARKRIAYAVKRGYVEKPVNCEYADCELPPKDAHHPDHNWSLDVIWLCRPHHMELHRNI